MASGDAATGKKITVKLDNIPLGTVDITSTGGWETYQNFMLSDVTIPSGSNKILRLEFEGIGYNVNWIEFLSNHNLFFLALSIYH